MCLQVMCNMCIKRIWHYKTYNGWYAIKPHQTKKSTHFTHKVDRNKEMKKKKNSAEGIVKFMIFHIKLRCIRHFHTSIYLSIYLSNPQ